MKINYINKNFKNIDKIVSQNSKHVTIDILHRGSSEEFLDLTNLNEYGWEFLVTKLGEADGDGLQYLRSDIKENYHPEEIDVIRKVLFPTDSNEECGNIKYFGSVVIGSRQLMMVKLSAGSSEAFLYDDFSGVDPKIKLEFSEYETTKEKIFWFIISSGEIQNIDLSQFSWMNSRDPHRNQKNYLMSPNNISDPIKIIQNTIGEEIRDITSGNLLGNKLVENHIALDRRLRGQENNTWDRRCVYKFGSIVSYNGLWKSTIDNNKDNIPGLSNKWVIFDQSSEEMGITRIVGDEEVVSSIISPTKYKLAGNNSIEFRIMFGLGETLAEDMLGYFKETEEYVWNPKQFNYDLYKNTDLSRGLPYGKFTRRRDFLTATYADFRFKKVSSVVKFPGENPEEVEIGSTIEKELWRGNKGLPKRIIKSIYLDDTKEDLIEQIINESPVLNSSGNLNLSVYANAPCYVEIVVEESENILPDNKHKILLTNYSGFYVDKSSEIFKQGDVVVFNLIPVDKENTLVSIKTGESVLIANEDGSLSHSGDNIGELNLIKVDNKYTLTISNMPDNNIEFEIWR